MLAGRVPKSMALRLTKKKKSNLIVLNQGVTEKEFGVCESVSPLHVAWALGLRIAQREIVGWRRLPNTGKAMLFRLHLIFLGQVYKISRESHFRASVTQHVLVRSVSHVLCAQHSLPLASFKL